MTTSETTAAMAHTMVTTHRSWSDRGMAQDTGMVPASIAAAPSTATTARDTATGRSRRIRRATAPASPAPAA